jgi:hypothetical protein
LNNRIVNVGDQDENAIHSAFKDQTFPAKIRMIGRPTLHDDDMPSCECGRRLDAFEYLGKTGVPGVRNDEANGLSLTRAKASGDAIWTIAESAGDLEDRSRVSAFAGFRSSPRRTRETVEASTPARNATSLRTAPRWD